MSACYISMTRSVSGRVAAVEQGERGETGGCEVGRTWWGRGVNWRYKKRVLLLTSDTWQLSEFMNVCVHVHALEEKLSEPVCYKCNM